MKAANFIALFDMNDGEGEADFSPLLKSLAAAPLVTWRFFFNYLSAPLSPPDSSPQVPPRPPSPPISFQYIYYIFINKY